jgi:hypothetical protein
MHMATRKLASRYARQGRSEIFSNRNVSPALYPLRLAVSYLDYASGSKGASADRRMPSGRCENGLLACTRLLAGGLRTLPFHAGCTVD